MTVRFINFFLVWTVAQPGIHSVQTKRFGIATGDVGSCPSPHESQTSSWCLQPGLLGPGMQNSSTLQLQQVISTFRVSHTSRHTFWQSVWQPHCWQLCAEARSVRGILIAMIARIQSRRDTERLLVVEGIDTTVDVTDRPERTTSSRRTAWRPGRTLSSRTRFGNS